MHLRHFKDGQVRLHLYYGAAEDSLAVSDFHADIWFLDGFAPAKSADVVETILRHVGRLTGLVGALPALPRLVLYAPG